MTGLSWMLLTAAMLLLPGDSSCAVDQNTLASIINEIWKDYKPNRMFSMAVSIPYTQNKYDVNGVLNQDNGAEVVKKIKSGQVFTEGRVVAATFLTKKKIKADDDVHAEYRVLENFHFLLGNNNNFEKDLLIFYVLGSPCYHKCTNPDHPDAILKYLGNIKKWENYAFVFSYIYESKSETLKTTDEDRRAALENLAVTGGLGLQNIFRCENKDGHTECSSCSQNQRIAHYCISNEPEDKAEQQSSSRGGNNSPSQSIKSRNNSPSQSIRNNSPSQSIKSRNNSPSQSIKSRNNSPSQSIRNNSPSQSIKSRNNSPSQSIRNNSPPQSIKSRNNSPSQSIRNNSPSQSIRNNSPSQSIRNTNTGNNQRDSLMRRLCLSCLNCCQGRRPLSDKW